MARDSRNVVNQSSSGGQGPHTRREAGDPRQTEDGGNKSSFDYAGPIGMNANPMDGAQVMEEAGGIRKKKKNPMDMGMDYAGPESPQGFEGMAGNTFSSEGLDKMNQHYAQTQQSMA